MTTADQPSPDKPVSPFEKILVTLLNAKLVELTDPSLLKDVIDNLESAVDRDDAVLRDLGTWLVDQDEVDDVYASDLEIQAFLRDNLNA